MLRAQYKYVTNNGTITITGYTGPGGDVAIPSTINDLPVTAIGRGAFLLCGSVSTVTIPASITNIGDFALNGCYNLTAIEVDGANQFYSSLGGILFDTSQATLIQFPGGKPGICTIPASVTNIENGAFFLCTNLTAISVPLINESFASVDGVLFDKTQTTLITCPGGKTGDYIIPNTVTRIADSTFAHCTRLTSVKIPNSVADIGASAFSWCEGLTNIMIGNSVTNIESGAFNTCFRLANVTIPSSVSTIGGSAFNGCSSLQGVYFKGNAPVPASLVFGPSHAIVYYLPGTTNWGPFFGAGPFYPGRPTMLWNPQIQTSAPDFGILTNRFGFTITGTPDIPILIEASTDLSNPAWLPLQSLTLTNGSYYFTDSEWTNSPARFYRIRSP